MRRRSLQYSRVVAGGMKAPAPGSEDTVVIEEGKKAGDAHVITVNCPDRSGLGCDICRIILDFGLYITKGDVSTDGVWCYIVLWVLPHYDSLMLRWSHLRDQLVSVCPSCSTFFVLNLISPSPAPPTPLYLLNLFCLDRRGLLHDVTHVLTQLELSIQTVKVTTTPDGRVLDLFFITDSLDRLHTKKRQHETLDQLRSVLGESCISCDLHLAAPEYDSHQNIPSLSPAVPKALFTSDLTDEENHKQVLSDDVTKLKNSTVTIDNSLSPAHTLLLIRCVDHRALLYDVLRTLKDYDIKISYSRFSPRTQGHRDLDLFIKANDGKKIVDPDKQNSLCSRLKAEMLHPLRVMITNRGPDTELLIANPVERSGKGRPRVFYDVTLSLKLLGICIFSAEILRYTASDREWEVYRFLLDENCLYQLSSASARIEIANKVRRTLMGW